MKEKKVLWLPEFVVIEAKLMETWREENKAIGFDDERGVEIMIDPEHADDTFICWYPKDNSYSTDFDDSGRFKTLKEALVNSLSLAIEYSDDEYLLKYGEDDPELEIDKVYLDFIKKWL